MEYPERKALENTFYEAFRKKLTERHGGVLEKEGEKEGDGLVEKLYLEPQEGCLPDEFIGEELLYDIQAKFHNFFSVLTEALEKDFLEKQGIKRTWISVWIDPSYDDETQVILTFQSLVVLKYESKAWNFAWPSVAELKKEMADLYYRMRDRLNVYFWEGIRYQEES